MNTATTFVHTSIAEIPEEQLVDRIATDIIWGREFFQFYGMPSGMVSRQRVSLQSAPGAPRGDIDVLFCAPTLPKPGAPRLAVFETWAAARLVKPTPPPPAAPPTPPPAANSTA